MVQKRRALYGLSRIAVKGDDGKLKHYVGIFSDVSQLKQHEQHLHHIAHHDALTGLPNRLSLTKQLSQAMDDADSLLRYADQAMYFAKSAGRNQFVFYGSEARIKIKGDNHMLHDLRQALKQGRITVEYQPIVDMMTGRVVKAGALASSRARMIPPSAFIPVAENGGLIHEIGDLVFAEAARVADAWNR
jgi:predicted signal transduction protein with EAL and GGDEF domain